ncbi:mammalian cell entry protein [Nocardia puris]|uniref:ABC-type transporter Mla subunit MlaD n=1 Tax=Nocardia puris TaxID=208602 RepID=A0A366DAT2_9NOCA|nr:mammalian cell entry protein [Nocardia puris]MBF6214129.1 mammalian cell entry protein [Nocardia puris]MBF6368587.1 mammalian cell entry protein [Nocardia puris]MBF6461489.1 mammalian cell entry protein [Nocardia puris]RBO86639.1 ABC-type transporter Mla subunit MlaD [Nocardia puris]
MPNYGLPGVAANKNRARTVGLILVALILVIALATSLYRSLRSEEGLRVALHTELIGDGVTEGTQVRLDGVLVGEVTEIAPAARGTQRISLRLDESRLHGIDDSMLVDYAPANLFGISELALKRGPGGAPLRENAVIDLTGPNSGNVYDATMGSILRSLSQVGESAFSPRLATVIAQLSADFKSFTPLVQALITVAQTIADNQTMPANELLGRLGPAFDGGGDFAGATIEVLDQLHDIRILHTDRDRFDVGVAVLTGSILPGLSTTVSAAGDELAEATDMLAPLLAVLAQMVPRPQQSADDLRTLLERLGRAMPNTPEGPVLNLEVDLRGVPGIAVPLLGQGGAR